MKTPTIEVQQMPLVKVKNKFQVTIPDSIRIKAGIKIGDILEADFQDDQVVLKPKVVVDKKSVDAKIADGLKAYAEGRVTPAFSSMEDFEKYTKKSKSK